MDINVKKNDSNKRKVTKKIDFVIVLDNLRSASNVGNIYRLAESLNIQAIYPCGYTPYPPHSKITKTARGTENDTPSFHFNKTRDACKKLKNDNYKLLGIETVTEAINLWNFQFELKSALIFGNEALGISEDVLKLCDALIELPLLGRKNSINVSNCVSATLFKAIKDVN